MILDYQTVDERFLNSIGFLEEVDPFLGKIRSWGRYTTKGTSGQRYDSPILIWDENTQIMYAHPLDYKKKITSIEGFRKMIDSVNFLMSKEQ